MKFSKLFTFIYLFYITSCGSNDPQTLDSAESAVSKNNVSVLSYNAYLLKTGLKNTLVDERAQMIPDALATYDADIVVLQEVWEQKHVDYFIGRMASHGYKYYAYKNTRDEVAHLGNGKIVFSKYPIYPSTVNFESWPNKTSWTEKKANKGLLAATVNIDGKFVRIYNAHTSTKRFDPETGDFDAKHVEERKTQFDQVIDAMQKDDAPYKVLAADLNMHPFAFDAESKTFSREKEDAEYAYIRTYSKMKNALLPSQLQNWKTFDPPTNSWAANGIIVDETEGQLIDYQLFSGAMKAASAQIVMQDSHLIPFRNELRKAPLSDHYGLLVNYHFD